MIKKEKISVFVTHFERVADWDGEKYFRTLNTKKPEGTLTIMKYQDVNFSTHRKNDLYWDIVEIKIDNNHCRK